jgi:hypothetical protein
MDGWNLLIIFKLESARNEEKKNCLLLEDEKSVLGL